MPADAYSNDLTQGGFPQVAKQKSPSPDENGGAAPQKHRRNYQACERCRNRKVKCDLGSVDAPHSPPCARCKREQKECYFADQRKKRKSPDRDVSDDSNVGADKRQRTVSGHSTLPDTSPYPPLDHLDRFEPRTSNPQARLNDPRVVQDGLMRIYPNPHLPYPPTAGVEDGAFRQSHRASPREPERLEQRFEKTAPVTYHNEDEVKSKGAEVMKKDNESTSHGAFNELILAATKLEGSLPSRKVNTTEDGSGPNKRSESPAIYHNNRDRLQALRVWRKMRLVQLGFFTAEEAIKYVEYFYVELQPMTPVDITEFRSPQNHTQLLVREPILALTILAISSRYMPLKGHAATSRSYAIHAQLWDSLRSKIQHLLWAQEQFGGGFTGAGSAKVRETAPGQLTWPGTLRTLGTIKALLLLTDWQPRALHFPPGADEPRLLDADYDAIDEDPDHSKGTSTPFNSQEVNPYAFWLEPAWRSDKMSWMLLGLAQCLSYELGVFDRHHEADRDRVLKDPETHDKFRLQRLVLVYVAQTSGRMGIPSPLVLADWPAADVGSGPELAVDRMQALWVRIASIMNQANIRIFPSKEFTKHLTQGDDYRRMIEEFTPMLQDWKEHFNRVKGSVEEQMQQILLMEYEYARLYINSLGLSNVMEKWIMTDRSTTSSSSSTLAKAIHSNKRYINELTEAALHILKITADEVGGKQHLRQAPVRAFLRCLSAMMFTLKRLSLGNHERMVRKSLELLDRVVYLLGEEVVDDVHLSSSTSQLVKNIVANFRQTLIRVAKPVNMSGAQSRNVSRPQSPQMNGQILHGTPQQQPSATVAPSQVNYAANDSLADIQARPMSDLMDRTFIPPPNFNFQTNDFDPMFMEVLDPGTSVSDPEGTDWFAMPLDNLWTQNTDQINQGSHSIGPTIGQRDMLQVLTDQDYNHGQWSDVNQHYSGFAHL